VPNRANTRGSRPRIRFSTLAFPDKITNNSRAKPPSTTMISPLRKNLFFSFGKIRFQSDNPNFTSLF